MTKSECIKAYLDLYKIMITGGMGAIFFLVYIYIQNPKILTEDYWWIYIVIFVSIWAFILCYMSYYKHMANKLKDE